MKWKIYIIFIIILSNCSKGLPDDETNCDLGRVLALAMINQAEITKENGKEGRFTNLFPAMYLIASCNSDDKRPNLGP
jgi:hypothetical protein